MPWSPARMSWANTENGAEFKTVTTGTGTYTIPSLPAGHYNVIVQAAGFQALYAIGH
ncbi:MAG: carboxypeptidase-like regulatory domain-containing protein [Acidobacteriota bacterium]|nr:carboxypeptidase-like regulatory domain-containing protein [Acidobacteriota bacterium]